MNYLDAFLIIPLLWGVFIGFKKGFIIQLATLVALGVGTFSAIHFSDAPGAWLQSIGVPQQHLKTAGFILIFLVVVILILLLAKLLEKVIKIIALGIPNRLAGSVFGLIKYALLTSVLLYFTEHFSFTRKWIGEEVKKTSLLYAPLKKTALIILPGLEKITILPPNAAP